MSDETDTPAPGEESSGEKKRLTPEEWREIEVHWEYGTMRTKEICEKFGITPSAVTQHFAALKKAGKPIIKDSKKHLMTKKATEMVKGAAEATARKVSEFESKRKDRIEVTKESIYSASTANFLFYRRIQKQIADGIIKQSEAFSDYKALRMAEAFIKLSRENRYAVLDIENDIDERDLPTLVFEDLTQEEIKQIQEGDDDDFDDVDLLDDGSSNEDEVVVEGET